MKKNEVMQTKKHNYGNGKKISADTPCCPLELLICYFDDSVGENIS